MLRVPFRPLREGKVRLDAEAARYVARVHRLAVGDRLLLFDPEARSEAEATIVDLGPGEVWVELTAAVASTRVALRPITVIQALAKGTKLDAVVRDATELGATRVVAALAARSVARADKLERWRRVAVQAARQCLRGDVPEVLGPMPLDQALERHGGATACILHPRGGAPLGRVIAGAGDGPITLAIGPEGGFEEGELALAEQLGYQRVTLGRFVLRTETACAAALGAIAALTP